MHNFIEPHNIGSGTCTSISSLNMWIILLLSFLQQSMSSHKIIQWSNISQSLSSIKSLIPSFGVHSMSRSNQQNYCVAQNLVITYQPISGCCMINGERTQSTSLIWLGDQQADIPPSKMMCCPVVMALLSLSKNKTVFTTSSSSEK